MLCSSRRSALGTDFHERPEAIHGALLLPLLLLPPPPPLLLRLLLRPSRARDSPVTAMARARVRWVVLARLSIDGCVRAIGSKKGQEGKPKSD